MSDVHVDSETVDGEAAFARVSREDGDVRLVVSIVSDGDYDVLLRPATARELARALTEAAEEVG